MSTQEVSQLIPKPQSSDADLVAAARRGDTRAFTQLVRRHDDSMRGAAWTLVGNHAGMEDVLQDAYIKAFSRLESLNDDAAFRSWLYRIVQATSIDYHRSHARTPQVPIEAAEATILHGPDTAIIAIRRSRLRDALARLTDEHRAVVVLVDGIGMEHREVAQFLDIAPGTVASRINRARKQLRTLLTEGEAQ